MRKRPELHVEGSAVARLRARRELDGAAPLDGQAWRGASTKLATALNTLAERARTALEAKQEGPYADWMQAPESTRALAWELSELLPEKAPQEDRDALQVLAFVALSGSHEGSTYLPTDEVMKRVEALQLDKDVATRLSEWVLDGKLSESLSGLVAASGYAPLLLTRERLALQRLAHFEARLAEGVATLRGRPGRPYKTKEEKARVAAAMAEVVKGTDFRPTAEQQLAVLNSAHLPFSVISGGPGTGKTTIVVSLLRLLMRLGVEPSEIGLAAPTGKAAYRMGEAIRTNLPSKGLPAEDAKLKDIPPAQTLHRLLGYSPSRDRFTHGENHPLPFKVVVVDECSMVDLFLVDQLVRACGPGTQLVLVGDADQLPSVEAGAVFRGWVPPLRDDGTPAPSLSQPWHEAALPADGERLPETVKSSKDVRASLAVRLMKSFRMDEGKPAGRHVYLCAKAINAGKPEALREGSGAPVLRASVAELEFKGVERLELQLEKKAPAPFFEAWDAKFLSTGARREASARTYHFKDGIVVEEDKDALEAFVKATEQERVLCLTRGEEAWGAGGTNAWFHAARAKATKESGRFLPGEPVIILQNDYERMLFNGDQGVVVRAQLPGEATPRARAVFPRGETFAVFELEALAKNLAHAYALTVHKAQGSEMKHAAVLLPPEKSPLLVRELLYTAVSRAKESVTLLGPQAMVELAVKSPNRRWSSVLLGPVTEDPAR
jgi:exodeoxyribonuclease V alpha subunit